MTEDQKRILTERLLGEKWIPNPKFLHNRTFTTWQDLGDCKETLVKKGLGEEFIKFCYNKWVYPDTQVKINPATILAIRSSTGFDLWLFRPTNENGEPHFCRLCCNFLEEIGYGKDSSK